VTGIADLPGCKFAPTQWSLAMKRALREILTGSAVFWKQAGNPITWGRVLWRK